MQLNSHVYNRIVFFEFQKYYQIYKLIADLFNNLLLTNMKKKTQGQKGSKYEEEKAVLLKAIDEHPLKPSKISDLAKFYEEYQYTIDAKKSAQFKRLAFDTYLQALQRYDKLRLEKNKNGAVIKLDRKEHNQKCNVLEKILSLAKDEEVTKP